MISQADRKQSTRDRIVDVAAHMLLERGFGGIGVADTMGRAGLTHGGFYAHFPSREALLAEALERAGQDSQARLERCLDSEEAASGSCFRALVQALLSDHNLQSSATGCPVAALASDIPRQSARIRSVGARRFEALTLAVAAALGDPLPEAAGIVAAHLVGTLQTARMLGNNENGRRHLAAGRSYLLAQFDTVGVAIPRHP